MLTLKDISDSLHYFSEIVSSNIMRNLEKEHLESDFVIYPGRLYAFFGITVLEQIQDPL